MWSSYGAMRYIYQPASSAFQLRLFVALLSILAILHQRDSEVESAMGERDGDTSISLIPGQIGAESVARIIQLPPLRRNRFCEVCGDFEEKEFDEARETELDPLLESSRAGCPSCLLVCHVIDLQWHALAREGKEDAGIPRGDIFERINALNKSKDGRWDFFVRLRVSGRGSLSIKTVHRRQLDEHHNSLTHIFAEPGSPNPWHIIKPDITACRDVDGATNCIKMWKENSFDVPEDRLPTRVLEIYGPQKVRLYEPTSSELGRYACLSYCWGKDPHKQLRTTRSSIAQHRESISWAALPLTFRDALEMTRKLSLTYLWIDSLCIVQDDKEDWRREGGNMATIYSKSYITFAATNSASSDGGLFNRNPTGDVCEIQRGDSVFNIRAQHAAESSTPFDSSMALMQRAWFFQERALSPQIVHFAANELFWEDSENISCECYGTSNLLTSREYQKHHLKLHQSSKESSSCEWWYDIVAAYTRMHLTFESDIFPALQGIAHIVQQQRDCAYYAGLWEDSLVEDMLWYCPKPCIRPQNFRAPTWSWASVNGPISYMRYRTLTNSSLATVKSTRTSPVGTSRLGQLRDGSLRVRAPGFRGTISSIHRILKRHIPHLSCVDQNEFFVDWFPDVHEEVQSGEMVFLRMERSDAVSRYKTPRMLCFQNDSSHNDLYKRVGYLYLHLSDSEDLYLEPIEITVV